MNLKSPISEIPGIGPAYIERLKKLGIENVEDFLLYLPRKWLDFSNIVQINRVKPNEMISVHGEVLKIINKRSRQGRIFTEAVINDGTGSLKAVWFNQPYLTNMIKEGDEVYLAGKIEWNYGGFSMVSPAYEVMTQESGIKNQESVGDDDGEKIPGGTPGMTGERKALDLTHVGRIVPIYPETEGVSSKWLRGKIKPLTKYIYSLKDYLPESVKREEKLIDFAAAVRQLHFPESLNLLKVAKDRFDFDEMFLLQLTVLNAKKQLQAEKAISISFQEELIKKFVQKLSFELTRAQRRSLWEIIQDTAKSTPMNRLLEGDVGSGKTIVAALAIANTAGGGAQSVLLAPTEILAKQHFDKIQPLLADMDIEVGLLTGSTPKEEKTEILAKLNEGELKVIIGTHALLEKNVKFWRIGLAIVDEQHRFGVEQRNALRKESEETGTVPHFLSMTATPIPRTLTLTLYGDLDVSVLDEMPAGRKKIVTKLVPTSARAETYKFVEKELKAGRQAFVVCPLIGDSEAISDKRMAIENEEVNDQEDTRLVEMTDSAATDELERKSVIAECENLKKVFPDFTVSYLHGRMSPYEKEKTMNEFLENKIQILVSTSVIEVGVDVPNATIMLIENAERFGLATLHQFRGRVGRGESQSYCFLFAGKAGEDTVKRLRAMTEMSDGFKLAQIDLELRGPGDFIRKRQHGLPDIKMKNLLDVLLIKRCRAAAEKFLTKNDIKNFSMLAEKLAKYDQVLHLE